MPDHWELGDISPHSSSQQRGRGEGSVNLPTALLIAHMPGHQEPAVTVETISTLPSPSLHGVGLRQGIQHPPLSFFVTFFSLSPPPSFVSPLHLALPRLPPSLSPGHPSSFPYFPGLPCSAFIPAPCSCLSPSFAPSYLLPLSSAFLPFSGPPLYEPVSPSLIGKRGGWTFFRALRTKFRSPS